MVNIALCSASLIPNIFRVSDTQIYQSIVYKSKGRNGLQNRISKNLILKITRPFCSAQS